MPDGKKNTRLLSPFVPFVGVGAVALGFLLLRPGPEARARGLFHQGRPDEALRIIRDAHPTGRAATRMNALELEILADVFMKSDASVQRRVWADAYRLRLGLPSLPEAANPLPNMTLNMKDPDGIWEPRRDTILSDAMKAEREALARRLLGVGKPGVAAELLAARIAFKNGAVPVAERLRLADYYRQAGRADKALEAIAPIPEKDRTGELREMRIALLRESGRQREALAALIAGIGDRDVPPEELAELHLAALAAADPGAVLPLFARRLAAHPGDEASRRLYSDLLANKGDALEAARQLRLALGDGRDNRKDLERIAQLYGWADDLPGMENALLRLAILGDTGALKRLYWAPGIPDDPSLPAKLADAVGAKGRDAELKPAAAYLSAIGDYDLALRVLRVRLSRNPDDLEALSVGALILFETGEPREALPLLARAVKLSPKDVALRHRYADALLLDDNGAEALVQYRYIADHEHAAENVAVVLRLAEALGRTDLAADAAEERLQDDYDPQPEEFVVAQSLATGAGRPAKALEILKRGVAKFPDNGALRRHLATRLSDDTNHLAALEVMRGHPGIFTDPDAVALWLDLLILTEARADQIAFFKNGVPPVVATSPALRMRAARVLVSLERYREALDMQKALVADLPANREVLHDYIITLSLSGNRREALRLLRERLDGDTAESLRFAASAYADNGDFLNAERRTRRLLKLPGESTSVNWTMLGDFRVSQGDTAGARQAYRKAYDRLNDDTIKEPAR